MPRVKRTNPNLDHCVPNRFISLFLIRNFGVHTNIALMLTLACLENASERGSVLYLSDKKSSRFTNTSKFESDGLC